MSEKDLVGDVQDTVEDQPLSKAITGIAKHVVEQDERHKATLGQIEKKLEVQDDKLEESISALKDGQERLMKRVSLVPSLRVEQTRNFANVIPKEYKDRERAFDHAARTCVAEGLRDPALYMASTAWFVATAKMGMQRYRAQQSELATEVKAIEAEFNAVQKATLDETTDAIGGYLVPTLLDDEIHRLITDSADLWPRCRQIALQTKITNFPTQSTASSVAWIGEGVTLTQTEGNFGQVAVQADKLAARAKFSIELMQDSAPTLLQYLLQEFTVKMAGELDYQVIMGDGTTPELLGFVNDAGIIDNTLATGTDLTWSRVADIFTSAGEKAARMEGVWVCSPKGYAALIGLSDSAGMPVVQYGALTQGAPAGTVLGRPIVVSNRWSGAGNLDEVTESNTSILFGPPSAFISGTRQGMAWDVTDAVGWDKYEMDARLVGRFGGRPVVPGSWVLAAQINT